MQESKNILKRDLSKWDFIFLLVNGIVGAGIFGLPSKVFALSGVYSIFAMVVCAIIVFIVVLNFAEVASRFKKTGGPFLYTYTAFGPFPAFIIGWLILITRFSAYAALINLFIDYLSFFSNLFLNPIVKIITIVLITLILTIVNYRGIKNSAYLSNFLAFAKLLTLILFVLVGLFFINPELISFQQSEAPSFSNFSKSVFILIFAFTGFEAILVNTGEVKNPKKNIPSALLITILFIAVLYILIQLVSVGTLSSLATSNKPLTDVARLYMGPLGATLITIGALISIGGTLNAIMLIGSRLPLAFSEAKQLPKIFSFCHPKFKTPTFSLVVFSLVSIFISISGSFIYAVSISVISKVLTILIVCVVLIKLRLSHKPDSDFFKLPYGYIFAIIGVITSLWLLSSSTIKQLRDVFYAVLLGVLIFLTNKYFLNKKRED